MSSLKLFDEYRPLLFSIAYRMLGSAMEAEDMVQETFLRWQGTQASQVKSNKAYLTSIITRLCIDQLRSARAQREMYVGQWLPEPVISEQPPDDPVALAESLSMAFLLLLERLSPTERAVFLLREVFGYSYAEIAAIVGKSEANCRQLNRRAQQHVIEQRPRFETSPEVQEQLTVRFMDACFKGDVSGLVELLAEDVEMQSDGGGKALAFLRPIYGVEKVIRFFLNAPAKLPLGYILKSAWINGQPGVIGYLNGQPFSVMNLHIANGQIQRIYMVRNPDKFRQIPPLT